MNLLTHYEDKNIIVVRKPPGIASVPDKTGDVSLKEIISLPYLGVVHRLDRPVGGLIIYAKNEYFTKILSEQISNRTFNKKYLAVVCGSAKTSDHLEHYLLKNQRLNLSKVVKENSNGSKKAVLNYKLKGIAITKTFFDLSLIEVELLTGRHHQIRVQMSEVDHPIWGDQKYNKKFRYNKILNLALWSSYISFYNPETKSIMEFFDFPYDQYPYNIFPLNTIKTDCIQKAIVV